MIELTAILGGLGVGLLFWTGANYLVAVYERGELRVGSE